MKKIILLFLGSMIFYSYAYDDHQCEQATIDTGGDLYDAYERAKEALPEKQAYERALEEHARYRDDIKRVIEATPEGKIVLQDHMVLPGARVLEEELPEYLVTILDKGPYPEMENYYASLERYEEARDAYYEAPKDRSKKQAYERALAEYVRYIRYRDAIKSMIEVTSEGRAVLQKHMVLPRGRVLEEELPEDLADRLDRGPYPEMENYYGRLENYEKARDAYYKAHDDLSEQEAWSRFLDANEGACSEEKIKRAYYSEKVKAVKNRYSGFVNESQRNVDDERPRTVRRPRGEQLKSGRPRSMTRSGGVR